MSYDIYLKERATGETIELPVKHIMKGGTCCADYDEITGLFTVQAITEAWLNVTYNYTQYFCDATEGDSRFYGEDDEGKYVNLGIRGIYGKTGAESIPMLKDMAERIQSKVATESIVSNDYWTASAANAVKPIYQLLAFAELRPDGVWMGD
ncbi:MAG: hypothetical protein J6N21_09165 [Butyrivibrio sp.]|nr:hypothetical protein [Butyrivibrio sp.]